MVSEINVCLLRYSDEVEDRRQRVLRPGSEKKRVIFKGMTTDLQEILEGNSHMVENYQLVSLI